jgi:lipoprotein NlpI
MRKKSSAEDFGIDPSEPNRELWLWLLSGVGTRPKSTRERKARTARKRSEEYWDDHVGYVLEAHRQKREAYATDQEYLRSLDTD